MRARRLAASNMDPQLKHWDLMATTSAHSDAPVGYADSLRVLTDKGSPALDSLDSMLGPAACKWQLECGLEERLSH